MWTASRQNALLQRGAVAVALAATGCNAGVEPSVHDAGTGGAGASSGGASTIATGGASSMGPDNGANGASSGGGTPGTAGVANGRSTDASVPRPAADGAPAPAPDAGKRTPRGPSGGCGKAAPAGVSSDAFTKHDVTVTGVDPAFASAHPAHGGTWMARTYYVRLPAGYDPKKPYALSIGGGGCGNTDGTSGSSGGLAALPKGETEAIQVGLDYMYPENAGACFADDYVDTPDLPYFDAVLAQLEDQYCIDRDRVFVDGFSSGAWETYMLGCARAGVVRGIGTAEGGLRLHRPPCTDSPVAAILVAGTRDTENPIGPLAMAKNDSYGSAPARDDLLARNGCVGTATVPWDPQYPACVRYTGCPAAYPVVWCPIDAGHTDGGDLSAKGFWKFWSALP